MSQDSFKESKGAKRSFISQNSFMMYGKEVEQKRQKKRSRKAGALDLLSSSALKALEVKEEKQEGFVFS